MRHIPLSWVSKAPNFEGQCSHQLLDFWPKSDQRISRFVCGLLVRGILRIVMALFCKNNIASWVGAATFSIVIIKSTYFTQYRAAGDDVVSSILSSRLLF